MPAWASRAPPSRRERLVAVRIMRDGVTISVDGFDAAAFVERCVAR